MLSHLNKRSCLELTEGGWSRSFTRSRVATSYYASIETVDRLRPSTFISDFSKPYEGLNGASPERRDLTDTKLYHGLATDMLQRIHEFADQRSFGESLFDSV